MIFRRLSVQSAQIAVKIEAARANAADCHQGGPAGDVEVEVACTRAIANNIGIPFSGVCPTVWASSSAVTSLIEATSEHARPMLAIK